MNENYMALCVSILKGTSPEISFKLLSQKRLTTTPKIMHDIIEMRKEGMTYREIAKSLNMKPSTVHKRITRYNRKVR